MAEDFKMVFGDEVDTSGELIFVQEQEQEPYGSIQYFKLIYRERVNNFLKDFLHSNVESVISNSNGDVEQVKTQISNLVEVYYQARLEFDKHKNKLLY
ncbi:hypothetical protein SAMN05444673_2604 [Bacillus sp. OV166]|uniref:hypothetical protein n=1 Tax=Bacillus sp. OV166 TaxID=1882763 RepID=UPI000A2AE79F|nr:hypothetical protein [Bacillus sp. OV166]SMQ75995.1 hypothetical protein SAMN05444673_2604 [Bacillus sp. OV166]